jgi:hypothetical protein
LVKRWFYIDIHKALNAEADGTPRFLPCRKDRKLKENFDKDIVLDLSSPQLEYESLMYPLNQSFGLGHLARRVRGLLDCEGQVRNARSLQAIQERRPQEF